MFLWSISRNNWTGKLDCVNANIFIIHKQYEMIIGPKLDRVNRPLNEGFGNHGGHSAAGVPASFDLRRDGKARVFLGIIFLTVKLRLQIKCQHVESCDRSRL